MEILMIPLSSMAFDPVGDVGNVLSYLNSVENVDAKRLYIIGHSGGADVAITAGIEDVRISKIVALSPSRRVQERMGIQNGSEIAYYQRRAMRYMELSQLVSVEVLLARTQALPLENHLAYFSEDGHKPLLLIDGTLESEEDRLFLQQSCDAMVQPKRCITLAGVDHYTNVANWGSVVIYERGPMEQLVSSIDEWLSSVR
jgi:pimeloyl-ACP methyl ester carboxylesterase